MPDHPTDPPIVVALTRAIDTARVRHATYGDGYLDHGEVMAIFFPTGLTCTTPEQFARAALLHMVVTKFCRYLRQYTVGGHADSIHDLGVYAFLLEHYDQEIRGRHRV